MSCTESATINDSDSARFVDWKTTAKTGELKVREFAREDERRVMVVLDPFRPVDEMTRPARDESTYREQFENAVTLAACLMWHFSRDRIGSAVPLRARRDFARRRRMKSSMMRCGNWH